MIFFYHKRWKWNTWKPLKTLENRGFMIYIYIYRERERLIIIDITSSKGDQTKHNDVDKWRWTTITMIQPTSLNKITRKDRTKQNCGCDLKWKMMVWPENHKQTKMWCKKNHAYEQTWRNLYVLSKWDFETVVNGMSPNSPSEGSSEGTWVCLKINQVHGYTSKSAILFKTRWATMAFAGILFSLFSDKSAWILRVR